MDDPIAKLMTPESCEQFALNVDEKNPQLALAARRRAIELRANDYGARTEAEREAVQAVFAYERVLWQTHGRRLRATRTWEMIRRRGVIEAVERIVTRSADATGFTALANMGLLDMAFESVVLRHRKVFSAEAIAHSEKRLASHSRKVKGKATP